MATLEIQGKTFEVDGDGFLTDPSIWNEDVAKGPARGACRVAGLPKPDGCV